MAPKSSISQSVISEESSSLNFVQLPISPTAMFMQCIYVYLSVIPCYLQNPYSQHFRYMRSGSCHWHCHDIHEDCRASTIVAPNREIESLVPGQPLPWHCRVCRARTGHSIPWWCAACKATPRRLYAITRTCRALQGTLPAFQTRALQPLLATDQPHAPRH